MLIYAVSGKSRNGKDTLYLLGKDRFHWERVAFADCLKEKVSEIYGFSDEQMYGDLKDVPDKRYPNLIGTDMCGEYLTPRFFLQKFGKDQRDLCPKVWCSYLFNNKINKLINNGCKRIVITDVRFPNEIEEGDSWCRSHGVTFVTVRVERPGIYAKTGRDDISETALDYYSDWNIKFINSSTIDRFKVGILKSITKYESEIIKESSTCQ